MAKLLPHLLVKDFLEPSFNQEILNYAVQNEDAFVLSSISKDGYNVEDTTICESRTLYNLGSCKIRFQEKVRELVPEMIDQLKIPAFDPGMIEVQIGAYGDGAFFLDHIDTVIHSKSEKPRIISAIYYFHSLPKRFSGGELRLHTLPIGNGTDQAQDIIPENNSLLIFPSIAPHEVLPVVAPGSEFKDWRFAINCWVHRA